MINGIHHTSLSTKNLDRLVGFYRDTMKCEQLTTFNWDKSGVECQTIVGLPGSRANGVFLRAGGSLIEIFEYLEPRGRDGHATRPPWSFVPRGLVVRYPTDSSRVSSTALTVSASVVGMAAIGARWRPGLRDRARSAKMVLTMRSPSRVALRLLAP